MPHLARRLGSKQLTGPTKGTLRSKRFRVAFERQRSRFLAAREMGREQKKELRGRGGEKGRKLKFGNQLFKRSNATWKRLLRRLATG